MSTLSDATPHDAEVAASTLFSLEMEQSVLGGLIIASERQPDLFDDVTEILQPKDFYHKPHQSICRIGFECVKRGDGLDVLTLQTALAADVETDQIEGIADYVQVLVDNTAGTTHLLAHAHVVHDLAIRRAMVSVAEEIAVRARHPGNMGVEELMDESERAILNIADVGSANEELASAKKLLGSTLDALEDLYRNKRKHTGLRTGFPWLDDQTSGLQPGDLVVLAARPGVGKTSMAINIMEYALTHTPGKEDGKRPIVLFSMEMPGVQIMRRLLSSLASVNLRHMRDGKLTETDWGHIKNAATRINEVALYVDSSSVLNAGKVRHRVRRVKNIHRGEDPALIVIDYLQLMSSVTGQDGREENRNQEISKITRSLKGLAKEFRCPVLLLSQLSRNPQYSDRPPALVDLRDSGAIEQDADIVLFLHKKSNDASEEQERCYVDLIIGKHRNGPVGRCRLQFLGQTTHFSELVLDEYGLAEGSKTPRRVDVMEDLN